MYVCLHGYAHDSTGRGVALSTREGGDAVCDGTTVAFMMLDDVTAAVCRNTTSSPGRQPFMKIFASAIGAFAARHGDGSSSFLLSLVAALEEAQRYLVSCGCRNDTDHIRVTNARRARIDLLAALHRVRTEVVPRAFAHAARQCTFRLHASPVSPSSSKTLRTEQAFQECPFIGVYTCLVHTVLASVPRLEKKAVADLVMKLKTMQRMARSKRHNETGASNDPDERQDVSVCVTGGGGGSITCAALTGVLMDRPLQHARGTTKSGQGDVSVALMTGRLFDERDIDEYDRFHNSVDDGRDNKNDSDSDEDGFQAVADDMTQFAALSLSGKTYRVRSELGVNNRGVIGKNIFRADSAADIRTDIRTGDEHVHALLFLLGSLQVDLLVTTQRFHESLTRMITNAGIGVVCGVRADDFDKLRHEMRVPGDDGSVSSVEVITDVSVTRHIGSSGAAGAAHVRHRCSIIEYALRGSADKFVCISNAESVSTSLSALVCGPTRGAAKSIAAQIQRCWKVLELAERDDGGLELEVGGFCMELAVAHSLRCMSLEMRHAGEAPAMHAAIDVLIEAVLAPIRTFLFSASRGVQAHTEIVARRQLSERLRAMDMDDVRHVYSLIVRRCTPFAVERGSKLSCDGIGRSDMYDAMAHLTHAVDSTTSISVDTRTDERGRVIEKNQRVSASRHAAPKTSELVSSVAVWNTIHRHRDEHDMDACCDVRDLSWGVLHPSHFFSSRMNSVLETALLAIGTEEVVSKVRHHL